MQSASATFGLIESFMQMRDPAKDRVYIVAEARMDAIPGAVPKQRKSKKGEAPEQKGFEVGLAGAAVLCKYASK